MSRLWSRARRILGALAGVALGAAGLVALTSGPATASGPGCSGATIEVTTNTDAALRAAFTTANTAASGPSTICIDSGLGTITLGGTELAYTQATSPGLTVQGNGITISGNNASRVIHNKTAGPLTLNGVTITGGNNGGGNGGGVFAVGSVTLTNSTISGNTAASGGGGVFAGGSVTLTNSTISDNHAGGSGGGMLADGNVTLTNSTISGNTTTSGGGGGVFAFGGVSLVYATVVGNTAATGANINTPIGDGPTLMSFGSVIALPLGGTNCVGVTTSNGYNWDDDGTCGFGAGPGDHSNAGNPMLGALANNGGPTQTRLPLSGSPLIDAIPNSACQTPPPATGITTDQRSLARPSPTGGACDIGAVEVQPASEPAPAPAPVVITPTFTG